MYNVHVVCSCVECVKSTVVNARRRGVSYCSRSTRGQTKKPPQTSPRQSPWPSWPPPRSSRDESSYLIGSKEQVEFARFGVHRQAADEERADLNRGRGRQKGIEVLKDNDSGSNLLMCECVRECVGVLLCVAFNGTGSALFSCERFLFLWQHQSSRSSRAATKARGLEINNISVPNTRARYIPRRSILF